MTRDGPACAPGAAPRARALIAVIAVVPWLAACADPAADTPAAARGRHVYLTRCAVCHGSDPARGGPVAPAVKGASRALLEAKVLRGTYPPDYRPKRSTTLMPALPELAPELTSLADFLR